MLNKCSCYLGSSHVEGQIISYTTSVFIEKSSLILDRLFEVRVFCVHHKMILSNLLQHIFWFPSYSSSSQLLCKNHNLYRSTHLKQPCGITSSLGKCAWKCPFMLSLCLLIAFVGRDCGFMCLYSEWSIVN